MKHPCYLLQYSIILLLGGFNASGDIGIEINKAMDSKVRSDSERSRDSNRLPRETLGFFGLSENMDVLELLPGGGWYTKLLAPVLQKNGSLTVSIGSDTAEKLADQHNWDIRVIKTGQYGPTVARKYSISEVDFGSEQFDMVLTFRNLHNFTAASRAEINQAVLNSLRPNGLYGVVDHTRRHMETENDENWRRIDPVQVIKETKNAGFEFIDFSSIHHRASDELRYEVGKKGVSGNTDRFTLLFRKPQ